MYLGERINLDWKIKLCTSGRRVYYKKVNEPGTVFLSRLSWVEVLKKYPFAYDIPEVNAFVNQASIQESVVVKHMR